MLYYCKVNFLEMLFSKIVIYLGTLTIIITNLFCLQFIRYPKPTYFKWLYIYIIIGIPTSLNSIYFIGWKMNVSAHAMLIQQILITIQFLCFCAIFLEYNLMIIRRSIKMVLIAILLFVYIFIWGLNINNYVSWTNVVLVFSIGSIVFPLIYYKDLLIRYSKFFITKEPIFWAYTGFFFYGCMSFPVLMLIKFLPKHIYTEFNWAALSVLNISILMIYIFSVKAYLCLKHHRLI